MVVRSFGVDEVGDPVFSIGVIGLVDLDFVVVVVGGHDRREAGSFDTSSESAEATEQVDGDQIVMREAATSNSRPVLSSSRGPHRICLSFLPIRAVASPEYLVDCGSGATSNLLNLLGRT